MTRRASHARLSVDIEASTRRRLRMAAAQRGESMTEYIRRALARQLDDDLPPAIHAVDDPVLESLWDNDADAVYDDL